MPPEVILLYRIVLDILGSLHFHMKLSTAHSMSLKNFDGHCVESVLNDFWRGDRALLMCKSSLPITYCIGFDWHPTQFNSSAFTLCAGIKGMSEYTQIYHLFSS